MTTPAPMQQPLPFYVIFGKDDFLRTRALRDLVKSLLGDDRDNMAYVEFDGPTAEMADVLDECRTPSLLAPLRVVCVRDADAFVSRKEEEEEESAVRRPAAGGRETRRRRVLTNREMLEEYLQSPSPTGVLILDCRTWRERSRLYNLAEKIGRNIACEPPKRGALGRWAADHALRTYGCKLEYMAADRLADLVSESIGVLDSELAKLATYVAPRTVITIEDVESLVGASREEKVFGITDAIAKRDAAKALALWEQVLATERAAPYRAVGGLAWGFRRLAEGRRLLGQGATMMEAARVVKPWVRPPELPDMKRQICRFSLRQWQNHLVQLLHIDMNTKTGLGNVPSSVEKLIVNLCAAS